MLNKEHSQEYQVYSPVCARVLLLPTCFVLLTMSLEVLFEQMGLIILQGLYKLLQWLTKHSSGSRCQDRVWGARCLLGMNPMKSEEIGLG